jgi:iron complex transport system substrate-binding protein
VEHLPPARRLPRGPRRIVSLAPHATQVLRALDLGDRVVGTDERDLEALRPDLVVVGAPADHEDVLERAAGLPGPPEVLALDPETFGQALDDVRTIAALCHVPDAGATLLRAIGTRVDRVRIAVRDAPRPRVVVVERLDPVRVGGRWTPQLVDLAGGTDVLGLPGEPGDPTDWAELAALRPHVVVCAPPALDAPGAVRAALPHAAGLWAGGPRRVVALDAAGLLAGPGPRLVDALEVLGHLLHPELVPAPPADVLDVPRSPAPPVRA